MGGDESAAKQGQGGQGSGQQGSPAARGGSGSVVTVGDPLDADGELGFDLGELTSSSGASGGGGFFDEAHGVRAMALGVAVAATSATGRVAARPAVHGLGRAQAVVARQQAVLAQLRAEPEGVRLLDKVSFTVGVVNIAFTAFVLGRFPALFHFVYSAKFVVLLGARVVQYRRSGNQYFMFDFCYFANLWVMVYLWLFPQSCYMFHTAFSFTNGPLVWAIAAWRNSLVFHSLDKITSVYIHLTPTLLMWALRFFNDEAVTGLNTCQASPVSEWLGFSHSVLEPLWPYLVWQIAYLIKVEIFDHQKIEKHGLTTSFRFLSASKGHPVAKLVSVLGPQRERKVLMFMLVQLLYTFLTAILVPLWWYSFWAHTLFLSTIGTLCAWNGANFYFHVFSRRYEAAMRMHTKTVEEFSRSIQEERGSTASPTVGKRPGGMHND